MTIKRTTVQHAYSLISVSIHSPSTTEFQVFGKQSITSELFILLWVFQKARLQL